MPKEVEHARTLLQSMVSDLTVRFPYMKKAEAAKPQQDSTSQAPAQLSQAAPTSGVMQTASRGVEANKRRISSLAEYRRNDAIEEVSLITYEDMCNGIDFDNRENRRRALQTLLLRQS